MKFRPRWLLWFLFLVLLLVLDRLIIYLLPKGTEDSVTPKFFANNFSQGAVHPGPEFVDSFSGNSILNEAGSMSQSRHRHWWVNSGGQLLFKDGSASTLTGDTSTFNPWYIAYSVSNPTDTDGGLHPQNIFRLVNRGKWENFEQSVYFKIDRDNLSGSPNRNESNGVFLFNRYLDGDNIYYTGLRVDGGVVIKKKYQGSYTTLAFKKIIDRSYDRTTSPNLLPHQTWIGLQSRVTTQNNQVNIAVFVDLAGNGQWQPVLEVVDNGTQAGPPLLNAGFAGIRGDFMDLDFKEYKIKEIIP